MSTALHAAPPSAVPPPGPPRLDPAPPLAAAIWSPRDGTPPDVETASEAYAGRFAGPLGAWFLARQTANLLELVSDLPAGATVLDVGGGHAQTTPPLVRRGLRVTVTGSEDGCRARLDRALGAGRYEFVRTPPMPLPFPDRSFDAVVAVRLLPHVADWQSFLAELARVARRCVVVDYADRRSANAIAEAMFAVKRRVERDTRRYLVMSSGQIARAAAAHGLVCPAVRRQFLFPMALHRALGRPALSHSLESLGAGLGLTRLFGSPVLVRVERRKE